MNRRETVVGILANTISIVIISFVLIKTACNIQMFKPQMQFGVIWGTMY